MTTLEEAVDKALHDGAGLFTLPQLADQFDSLGLPGASRAFRERIEQLEQALGWVKT